jgi:hypothetical protein
MEPYRLRRQSDGGHCVGVPYRGTELFAQPMFNKVSWNPRYPVLEPA